MHARLGLTFTAVLIAALQAPPASAARTFVPPPILMYHRVDVASPNDEISRDLTVTPSQLEQQLAYLKQQHVTAISMADLEERLKHRLPLDRTIVLTFDDGYADQYRYAVPLLRKFGDRATFYIVTGALGKPRHLTWEELRTMAHERMDIAAHGVQHDALSLMTAAQQRHQIGGSIKSLESALRKPIESYAYPSGRFNRATLAIVREQRIPLAVTTDPVNVIPPASALQLTRLRIHGSWTLRDFGSSIQRAFEARHPVLR